ncbi:MAG: hypothetical protein Kow00109_03230 [Acidobacteriota bacterium]
MISRVSPPSSGLREIVLTAVLLCGALLAAALGWVARYQGSPVWAGVFSLLSVGLAGFVLLGLGPRVLRWAAPQGWADAFLDRITRRGYGFLFLLLAVTFLVIQSGNNLWILLLSLLLALFLVSGLLSHWVLQGVELEVHYPERLYAGQTMVLVVQVTSRKRFPGAYRLAFRPQFRKGEERLDVAEKELLHLCRNGENRLRWEIRFPARGIWEFDGIQLTTSFPFGFVRRGRLCGERQQIVVYPALREFKGWRRLPAALSGFLERMERGMGGSLYNIRDYVWGDDARFVHWKATAKLHRPMVREFIEERLPRFHLLFSTWIPPEVPAGEAEEAFEAAVSWIGTLAYWWWRRGAGFFFDSGEFSVQVAEDPEQLERLLTYLAAVEPAERPLIGEVALPREALCFAAHPVACRPGAVVIHYLKERAA